ncbi:T9SS type A sorting domain-containing protein [Candidatus Latescibacterota bacterium]
MANAENSTEPDDLWTTYTTEDGLGLNRTRDVNADPRGGVWVGTFGGGVSYFDGTDWTTHTKSNSGLTSNDIISVAIDHNDVVWFGAGDSHVMSYDGTSWETHYDSPKYIHNIVIDHDNIKWIASNGNGLGRYDDRDWEISKGDMPYDYNIPLGLEVGPDNTLWIGYYFANGVRIGGIFHHTFAGKQVYGISAIRFDSQGSAWMASNHEDYGVWRIGADGNETYYEPENLITGTVWDMAIDVNDVVWFAEDGGVSSFDGVTWEHYTTINSGLCNNTVIGVTVDTENRKWFATIDGLSRFDFQAGKYLRVESPNGGEYLEQGTTTEITWRSYDIDTVNIAYSLDAGANWITIAENVNAANGHYTWDVPDTQTSSTLIRIADSENPEFFDESNGFFTITSPFVVLLCPAGDKILGAGTVTPITWRQLGVTEISLEYSIDSGTTWKVIADRIDADSGSYEWEVPEIETEELLIRISDVNDPSIIDESDSLLSVQSNFIVVMHPNGGERIAHNIPVFITWQSSDEVKDVAILYSPNNGENWSVINGLVPAISKSYQWQPNLEPSTKFLIRIYNVNSPEITDISDDTFTIVRIEDSWSTYTTADGLPMNRTRDVNADPRGGVWVGTFGGGVSYFNGTSWITYTTENSGLESNDIISVAVDLNDVVWFGAGDAHVTSYDGFSWRTFYDSPINIHNIRVDNNNVIWIASNPNGLSRYNDFTMQIFTLENSPAINNIPLGLALDVDNSIWAGFYYDKGLAHITDNEWKIYSDLGDPFVYNISGIVVDNNGVKWMAGSDPGHGVWSFSDASDVTYYDPGNLVTARVWDVAIDFDNTVWFAEDGGVSSFDGTIWRHYTTENSGLVDNTVIGVTVDTDNVKWFATFNGVSSFDYQTGPYIVVKSPNGGVILQAETMIDITWVSRDVIQARIDYSTDGGLTWSAIVDNIDAAAQTYTWTLPNIQSSECLVRLTDVSNPDISDSSNGNFTVSPPFLRLTAPNGGEKWAGGRSHRINWISVGIGSVRIEYSPDEGQNWVMIAESADAATGTLLWETPDDERAGYLVRITDTLDVVKNDESDGVFSITSPWIELKIPNGDETWVSKDTHSIRWLSDGVDDIRIEYSVDGGLSWNIIRSHYDALTGAYSWKPYDVESMLCMVRLTDNDKISLFDTSDGVFSVLVISGIDEEKPIDFAIHQNTPNPFNEETTITYSLPEQGYVTLMVYAMNGQLVDTLVDTAMPTGYHSVQWKGDSISSGLYFAILRAGGLTRMIKMMLIK